MVAPEFKLSYLLPQYWLVWLGVIILFLLVQLPYPLIRKLGNGFGRLLPLIAKKRVKIAERNLELCFPEWSPEKRQEVLQKNLARTGNALFETAMGWWWPAWRVKKHVRVEGYEKVKDILASGQGVFALALHNVNLEMGCRGVGYTHKCVAFYRKHDNPLIDYLQYHGRSKSNDYMIDKRSSKMFIQAMQAGKFCIYFPDQDYGKRQSIFVPFGGVEQTATTTATIMFAERGKAVPFLITSQYTDSGWVVKFVTDLPYLVDTEESDAEKTLSSLNKDILSVIEEQPESYLWMHKRFKSRPQSAPDSLYR